MPPPRPFLPPIWNCTMLWMSASNSKSADKIGRVPIEYPTCILLQELVKGITTYEREEKSLRPLGKQVLQAVED